MSYSDETKKQAYDLYVEKLKSGVKEHNILKKIADSMEIPVRTLQLWRQDNAWMHKARQEVILSRKTDFLEIILNQQGAALEHITPENAAEILKSNTTLLNIIYQGVGGTNETDTHDGNAGANEDVDAGEIFGDDTTISPIFSEIKEKPVDD